MDKSRYTAMSLYSNHKQTNGLIFGIILAENGLFKYITYSKFITIN